MLSIAHALYLSGYHSGVQYLDERADDSQGGEPQILKGTSLADGVEEGIEVERDVGWRGEMGGTHKDMGGRGMKSHGQSGTDCCM